MPHYVARLRALPDFVEPCLHPVAQPACGERENPSLKPNPDRPKNEADRCGADAGSPILVGPISAPVTEHPEFTCPLATSDNCSEDRSA